MAYALGILLSAILLVGPLMVAARRVKRLEI
jgi:hypothetical protein